MVLATPPVRCPTVLVLDNESSDTELFEDGIDSLDGTFVSVL